MRFSISWRSLETTGDGASADIDLNNSSEAVFFFDARFSVASGFVTTCLKKVKAFSGSPVVSFSALGISVMGTPSNVRGLGDILGINVVFCASGLVTDWLDLAGTL